MHDYWIDRVFIFADDSNFFVTVLDSQELHVLEERRLKEDVMVLLIQGTLAFDHVALRIESDYLFTGYADHDLVILREIKLALPISSVLTDQIND